MKEFEKMKKKARLLGIYLPIFIVILIATVTLKTIAALTSLNRYGYYESSVIINIAHITIVCSVFFFLTYVWTARSGIKLLPSFSSPLNYIPAGLVSTALLFLARHLFLIAKDSFSEWYEIYRIWNQNYAGLPALRPAFPMLALITLICSILAIASIVYFIMSSIFEKRISARRASYGIVTLLFFSVYVAFIYFDATLPINAPNKICDQMAYLATAVFFLYETRLSMGREKWRPYIAFGFIASILTAFSSIPALIVYFVDGITISNTLYETVLTFTLFLFITMKLSLTSVLVEDKESPVVTEIIKYADKREFEINPPKEEETTEESEEPEADENQITISDINDEAHFSTEDVIATKEVPEVVEITNTEEETEL